MKLTDLHFDLPSEHAATEPPEAHGQRRDQSRLLVVDRVRQAIAHTRFDHIGEYLRPGDILVLNTSGTINAALPAHRLEGASVEIRLSQRHGPQLWDCDIRPHDTVSPGETLRIGDGALTAHVLGPRADLPYLWQVEFTGNTAGFDAAMRRYGRPIKYDYVPDEWDLSYYQNVYADVPGSAEMPSAGRHFTQELLASLRAAGVLTAALVLHTGVSSIDITEEQVEQHRMYGEWYQLSAPAAAAINAARAAGGRVVAVGTTVVRTLESQADPDGTLRPGEGTTELYITPGYHFRIVDALVTGLHEAKSTRLVLASSLAGRDLMLRAYHEALERGYLWHEFGDATLIL
jgi:S-adenosylmethionine:tRNA ribosyltransferase-isomerase